MQHALLKVVNMETSALWALIAAVIGATVTGIGIWVRLGTANKARSEAIYAKLLSELNDIVREIGNWNGKKSYPLVRSE